jgi:hypothetical protein
MSEADLYKDLIADAITQAFGERCPDHEPGCFCCEAWKQYDDLKAERERGTAIPDEERGSMRDQLESFAVYTDTDGRVKTALGEEADKIMDEATRAAGSER